jgi:hypothetical protein
LWVAGLDRGVWHLAVADLRDAGTPKEPWKSAITATSSTTSAGSS